MRCLFLVVLLAAGASAAQAQTPVAALPTTPVSLASAHYSPADTIRAVRHLFQRRIRGGYSAAAGGGALLARGVVTRALSTDSTAEGWRIDANQDILFGSAMLGYGLFQSQRFGPRRYQQIVTAYAQGEPLPDYVRRRLKPKFFRYREF